MAQAPAAPKLKRAALLAATAVVGPRLARNGEALIPSERAALNLRAARPRGARPRAKGVTFLIPLVGPEHVSDWQAVTDRLATTMQGFLDQTDPNWRAVICCQRRPPLPDDPRITHLHFDDPTPGNDKWRKLAALCDHLGALNLAPGYVMSFDADDLLHRDAVAEMLARQDPGGYLVQSGYVMNHATGQIALAGPPTPALPLRKPFWKLCGSCAAPFHDPALPESAAFLRAMTAHEHRMFPYLARLAGAPLRPMSRPAVLYVLNHGENFGARRGRVGFKTRFVTRFAVTDPATLNAIAAEFPAP
ncbi:hypothetical protein DU478_05125 [Thalassococcus profundi]|uniref:Glycosyltransferase family 2 protein n=1 Tax=Thalassococcus profundi TaxID=2282382 RepID=A0A369TQW6_9RHOB|nr:hypothetical protein [Thalassococcus profundi]RDD67124.1 hypothetical protein DU478_05125 [Thalassococcus profundi]